MARLIPVEVVIPNIDSKIGSGLLARVNFQNTFRQQIIVIFRAIKTEREVTKTTNKLNINLQGTVSIVVEDGKKSIGKKGNCRAKN